MMADTDRDDWWMQLLSWLGDLDAGRYVEQASRYSEFAPQDYRGWWHLATAYHLTGNRSQAKRACTRARFLNPLNEDIAVKLCTMHIEDREIEAARDILDDVRTFSDSAAFVACEATWHAANSDWFAFTSSLRQLCVTECESYVPLQQVVNSAVEEGQQKEVMRTLEEMLFEERVQWHVATVWGGAVPIGSRRCWKQLERLKDRPEIWWQAAASYAQAVAASGQTRELARFVARFEEHLRANEFCWNVTGRALCTLGLYRMAEKWFREWRQSKEIDADVMLQAAHAMFISGREEEARDIGHFCETAKDPLLSARHALWLLAEDVSAIRLDEANRAIPPPQ